jgi:putative ABC transport system substrate-binding protein
MLRCERHVRAHATLVAFIVVRRRIIARYGRPLARAASAGHSRRVEKYMAGATDSLTRRQLVQSAGVVSLGLLACCGRLPGQAQPPPRVPRIGWLAPDASADNLVAFRDGLREFGYDDGRNLVVEVRMIGDQIERLPAEAVELAQQPVDVIVAIGSEATVAARNATATIPIIFPSAGDPVTTGLVDSLARPGGNVTGIANLVPQLSGKRLELLKDSVPGLSTVAYLWDPTVPQAPASWRETQVAAQELRLHLLSVEVSGGAPDLDGAFETAVSQGAGGLALPAATVNLRNRERIVALAAQHRLPAIYPQTALVAMGGLMAYGTNTAARFRRAAYYVDRVLKGAKPADLPVEQPTTFDFVINLRTAETLGLTIPQHVLLQATEVIQ